MTMTETRQSGLKGLFQRIKRAIIQDVPPELYACEICRKTQCAHGEWLTCENRIAQERLQRVLRDK